MRRGKGGVKAAIIECAWRWYGNDVLDVMHTVVETPEFLTAAKKAGMTEAEREAAVGFIAGRPDAGEIIVGSGGARKVRVRREGGGKGGGYRLITYYRDTGTPVFLLTVISKGQSASLTDRQTQAVKDSTNSEKRDRRTT